MELAKRLRAQHDRNSQLGLSVEEIAFYDALIGNAEDLTADEDVKALVAQIVPKVREALAVDWTDRTNLTSKVRRAIKQVLRAKGNKAIVERLRAREGAAVGQRREWHGPAGRPAVRAGPDPVPALAGGGGHVRTRAPRAGPALSWPLRWTLPSSRLAGRYGVKLRS